MTDAHDIFLSYSLNDAEAAAKLHGWLVSRGFSVFFDKKAIHEGELWLDRLQQAIDGCNSFVVLIGRDGVGRWVGAETQAALNRYFGPHEDTKRLPIFPILLGDSKPDTLPAFLRLFQAASWNGSDPLPDALLEQIRNRAIVANKAADFAGNPFVGLSAYRVDQASLFFGRQRQTLDALYYFGPRTGLPAVRWLEISGSSGSGKSSLMNAGLLPLIDHGWLFARTGYGRWLRIGPKTSGEHAVVMAIMPGQNPLRMLAEQLAVTFNAEMSDVRQRLEHGGDSALAEWLRSRKRDDTAFLLAIDQFEELFTFADAVERKRFDNLLAAALADADCPLYLISTVRVDFLDRFETHLPQLNLQRARIAHTWPLPQLNDDGLREIIDGPARLANLDVSEVMEMMVDQARGEPGALPLIENALDWLWNKCEKNPRSDKLRLSGRLFTGQGGLAGILSQAADDLLTSLGKERERALRLLFQLVKIDTEGLRHARRPIPLAEAVAIAGGGERGRDLVGHLAGTRTHDGTKNRGPLRLITVTEDPGTGKSNQDKMQWVNLIHETLIRNKGNDKQGKPQPYWPTLWHTIEAHKEQAAQREHLEWLARQWKRNKGVKRLSGLAGWWDLLHFWKLSVPGSSERTYLRWSVARASVITPMLTLFIGIVGESAWWAQQYSLPPVYTLIKPFWIVGYMPEPELVEIPAGKFTMGCVVGRDDIHGTCTEDETPAREVTISQPFLMGRYEVTFLEYDTFVWHRQRNGDTAIKYPSDSDWGRFDRPVIDVSWHDAKAYTQWLSQKTGRTCRLPSETEWEYAARSGTGKKYGVPAPNGSDDIAGGGLANCNGCGSAWDGERTAPVGSLHPNRFGLHDTMGNVWEWIEDAYQQYPDRPTVAGAVESESGDRVLRSGSWNSLTETVRPAARFKFDPVYRNIDIGFRVVCSFPIE